ncbi:hypothetical protein HYDPIDRAFT_107296 [Hydnomerulius pinastri MD-312]|nr:hypothetical protein HYDPIDRAFT_107296 [Hydnomerulius pinastri MD-312]
MVHQQKWYVVIVGTEPGVYSSWIEAGPKTKGIPGGAIYQSFLSEEEAIRVFEAAEARGEVKAYPIAGQKSHTGTEQLLLSPLEAGTSLFMPSHRVKAEVTSTRLQTPLSSPARSRAGRWLVRDSTDSLPTSSSPPTGVTQYAPLYVEDESPPSSPVRLASPQVTITSSSSRAYPDAPGESPFSVMRTREVNTTPRQEPSSRGSRTPASSYLGLETSDEEPGGTPTPRRREPLPPVSSSRSVGVTYQSLNDLADAGSIDSRIWLPKSRVFDPAKVKSRPATRPSSPAKSSSSVCSSYETAAESPRLRPEYSLSNSPNVRTSRGRPSRLTPSLSLPALPIHELEIDADSASSPSISSPSRRHVTPAKGKGKLVDRSTSDEMLVERPLQYSCTPKQMECRSHIQLVPREGKHERSAITVHCPPDCAHEACYRQGSTPVIDLAEDVGPRYADACVSPIISITSRVVNPGSQAQNSSMVEVSTDEEYALYGLTQAPYVVHRGFVPEVDVRSPIARGTMVPMAVAETPFGRPSPSMRGSNTQSERRGNVILA